MRPKSEGFEAPFPLQEIEDFNCLNLEAIEGVSAIGFHRKLQKTAQKDQGLEKYCDQYNQEEEIRFLIESSSHQRCLHHGYHL